MASSLARKIPTVIGALLLAATLFTAYTATMAQADHMPANKAGAAGSDIEEFDDKIALLSETMRVASPEDAIISVSAECSILTDLTTGPSAKGGTDSAFAFGSVRLWVEIDGVRVPVGTDDLGTGNDSDDEVNDEGDTNDQGEVTFCNRAYYRSVTDSEDATDGQDTEHDYIRTRTANAFNWLALNLGTTYDPDGDNIIHVVLWADFDEVETVDESVASAFVGSRTMIIEPTKVSNHESVDPHNPSPGPSVSPTAQDAGKGKP